MCKNESYQVCNKRDLAIFTFCGLFSETSCYRNQECNLLAGEAVYGGDEPGSGEWKPCRDSDHSHPGYILFLKFLFDFNDSYLCK